MLVVFHRIFLGTRDTRLRDTWLVETGIHGFCPVFGFLQHLQGLLLEPALLFGLWGEDNAMGFGVVVLVQVGESGEAVSCGLLGLAAAVHLGIDGEGGAPYMDHLALEGDDVAGEDGELEVDAVKHQQDRVLGVNILRHGEIRAFQEPLGASSGEEGLVVVEVGELDQTL